jgi:hypothetical protein
MNKKHNIHTLPVLNWIMFNETISKGEPDFALLFSEYNTISEEEGFEQYKNIINQIPFVHADLKIAFLKLQLATNIFHLKLISNQDFKKDLQKANIFFTDFCLQTDKENQSYNITEFSLNPDFKKIWSDLYKISIPESFNRLFNNGFIFTNILLLKTLANEYFPDNENLILNEIFIQNFILKKQVKINSIFDYINPIQDYFISKNKFNEFAVLRTKLILLSDEQKESRKKNNNILKDFYDTLFNLESFMKISIDPQKDSVYKFLTFIERAGEISESQPNAK